MVLLEGEIDSLAGADEQSIHQELKQVKFPLISVRLWLS